MATAGNVTAMFDALPSRTSNEAGGLARSVLVNKAKAVTPGSHTQAWPLPAKPPFREIFFPAYRPVRFEDDIVPVTGLGDWWWTDLSVAMIVDAIHTVSGRMRDHVNMTAVNGTIGSSSGTLGRRLTGWYAHVFALGFPAFSTPYAATPDKAAALDQYRAFLVSDDWIRLKLAQYVSGNWPDRDWELYHHWLKLSVLGASDAAVDALIAQVLGKGLPVPDSVAAGRWRQYLAWMVPLALSGADIQAEAAPGILGCASAMECFPEENAGEFMADKQPGSLYWQRRPPPPSCLGGTTLVRRPDGTATPIARLRRGDEVSTPDGPRRVLLLTRSPRADRPLYRIGGTGLRATAGHPWRVFGRGTDRPEARHASIRPDLTRRQVPGLADDGVDRIGGGVALQGWRNGRPVAVPVDGVSPVPDDHPWVYGVLLEPGADGFGAVIVTDGTTDLVTVPELPPVDRLPYASVAMLAALPDVVTAGRVAFSAVPAERFVEMVLRVLRTLDTAVPSAWRAAVRATAAAPEPAPAGLAAVLGTVAAFGAADGLLDWRTGALIDQVVMRFGAELRDIVDAGWRQPPCPDGAAAAVTVHHLLRDDSAGPRSTRMVLHCTGNRPIGIPLSGGGFRLPVGTSRPLVVPPDGPVRMTVAVRHGRSTVASGEAWTLWPSPSGYRRMDVPLRHRTGVDYGTVTLDLRALAGTPATAPTAWDEPERLRFATALGRALGQRLAAALASPSTVAAPVADTAYSESAVPLQRWPRLSRQRSNRGPSADLERSLRSSSHGDTGDR